MEKIKKTVNERRALSLSLGDMLSFWLTAVIRKETEIGFLTQTLPGKRSHLSRYWPPFHMCGSSRSPSAQSSRRWFA